MKPETLAIMVCNLDLLEVCRNAIVIHQRGHNSIFIAYQDNKLNKVAIIRESSDIIKEQLFDGTPRYNIIGTKEQLDKKIFELKNAIVTCA